MWEFKETICSKYSDTRFVWCHDPTIVMAIYTYTYDAKNVPVIIKIYNVDYLGMETI